MGKPLIGRVPFAKIVIVLAVAFGIALGLCGVTLVFAFSGNGSNSAVGKLLNVAAPVELVVMLLSGVGLVLTVIAWVVVSAFGLGQERSEPQRLFDNKDDQEPKDPR